MTMRSRRVFVVASCLLVALIAGCGVTMPINNSKPNEKSTASMVIKAGHIEESPALTYKGAQTMAEAEEAFAAENYAKARKLFGKVADDTANPALVAEKARFHEAECRRILKEYVDAVATYNKLLKDFQYGVYRERAVGQMVVIADFWLDDTRKQMDAEREKADGKRWFVPWNFVHFNKSKPLFDEEGHALKTLENVYFNDPTGPHAENALFRAGYVHFHRGNFKEADQMLSQMLEICERNPPQNPEAAKLRVRAYELAILAKNNATGGPAYDGRKSAEALQMIQRAKMTQPELVASRGDFLDTQMKMIRQQQAEKDFEVAEFYRRIGKAPAAWFYYELVRRRYQGTDFHDKAVARMKEIHGDLIAQQSQSEFAKATRREWNRIVLGHETPQLAKDQAVPGDPSATTPFRESQVTPVEHQKPVPAEFMPRR
jgi:outer membrane protein assembly factor BamD (BamD/ComL family)